MYIGIEKCKGQEVRIEQDEVSRKITLKIIFTKIH